jgi:hypothetical protein
MFRWDCIQRSGIRGGAELVEVGWPAGDFADDAIRRCARCGFASRVVQDFVRFHLLSQYWMCRNETKCQARTDKGISYA